MSLATPVRNSRRWWVIGVVGVAVMTALAVWFGVASAVGKANWVNTGFDVVAENEVQVRFDLRRDPSRAVECAVEAQDGSRFVVGRTTTRIEPTDQSPSRHVAIVQTTSTAVTGYVEDCRYVSE
ncbi:MAG: DUF4307 domain-containing protein [Ornithinimicrobium sp.]